MGKVQEGEERETGADFPPVLFFEAFSHNCWRGITPRSCPQQENVTFIREGCERGSALVALHDPAVSKLSFHKVFLVFFTFSRSVWPLRQAWSRAGGCSTFPGFVQELPGLVPIPGDAGMHRTPGSSGMSPVPILTPSRAHPLFCSSLQGRAGRRKCLCQ